MFNRVFVVAALSVGVLLSVGNVEAQRVETRKLKFVELQETLAKESPYYWHATGDKPDEFKVELKLNFEFDRSAPERTVQTWLALTDEREESRWTSGAVSHYIDRALRRGLRPYEEKLLTKDIIDSMDNTVFAENLYFEWGLSTQSRKPAEIESTTKLDDGSVQVTTTQSVRNAIKRSQRYDSKKSTMCWYDEEVETTTERRRLTCKPDRYGNWIIALIEKEVAEGESTSWQTARNPLTTPLAFEKFDDDLPEEEALEQATPELAALSVFTHLGPMHRRWRRGMHAKVWGVYLQRLRQLTSEDMYLEADKEPVRGARIKEVPEWEATVTRDDGTIEVRFMKPKEAWEPAPVVIVRRKGAGYEVIEYGGYRIVNDDKEPTYWEGHVYSYFFP